MENKLSDIKGIDDAGIKQLAAAGINSIMEFIEKANTAKERNELSKQTNIDAKTLTEWYNRADLMRVKGIGKEFANLLEECGVDTIKELQHRVPANLHAKLKETNEAQKITGRTPTLENVEDWVAQAKEIAAKDS
jgi:predicted flap endonuclease-1-like 5' DNA nuclease